MRPYYMSMIHAAVYTNSSCIVYNYMGNGTLLDFVNTNCHNPIHHTRIAHQILQMVHTLHQINIIHGDVKPDNIMVVSSVKSPLGLIPTLRLIDFGQSIDLAALPPNSAFTYNAGTSGFVCSQMKMNQPWNYHIDFNGIAGTLHVVLHRAYMKTYQNDVGEWVTTKRLPRVCQDRWKKAFHDLLNFPTPSDEWSPSIHDSPLPNLIQLFDV
uniref:Protein kinase domain-containing protein n=1 Tax=Ciona savignyi TaxID=51511 RepID=H2YMC5_CIOSA